RSAITARILRILPAGCAARSDKHLGAVIDRSRPGVAATQAQVTHIASHSGLQTVVNRIAMVATYHDRTTRRNDAGSAQDFRVKLLADPQPFATGAHIRYF